MTNSAIYENVNLLDDLSRLGLDSERCNLNYWIEEVAQRALAGLVNGHDGDLDVPAWIMEEGPLREALVREFSYRALTEEMATRTLSYLIDIAPTKDEMEFLITLVADEARHARVFQNHLIEIGIDEKAAREDLGSLSGNVHHSLEPIEDFALSVMRDDRNFVGGMAINTILVEGLLAPASELSERKWKLLDPVAASIEFFTGKDEIRHLAVGTAILKKHVNASQSNKDMILDLLQQGQERWANINLSEAAMQRETLFQEGMLDRKEELKDYYLFEDIKLIDTTPEQRLELALDWADKTQSQRLKEIGLVN